MPATPTPQNEKHRIDVLCAAALLDTGPEFFFEEAVEAVLAISGVPMAAVSLVDEGRQWFKTSRGLGVSETPRDCAFCSYTILGDEPLIVANARDDERFFDSALVTGEPRVMAYAGAPIVVESGARIGAVCLIDTKPREWSPVHINLLCEVTRLVSRYVDLRRALLNLNPQRLMDLAVGGDSISHLQSAIRAG
ncbi:MAG: GAF domain-containing protein [Proteobacteria bacterium]|nr:GAF domain-containing protein [Pseudomonadota bacterium]